MSTSEGKVPLYIKTKKMKTIFNIKEHIDNMEIKSPTIKFRDRRDELVDRLVRGINRLREGTKYKPLTKRFIAIKCNSNPFLVNDGELELEISECERKGSYAHFFWITK